MYAWVLMVTYLYSSFTAQVELRGAFDTKGECDQAAISVHANSTLTVTECRAVKYVNKDNTP